MMRMLEIGTYLQGIVWVFCRHWKQCLPVRGVIALCKQSDMAPRRLSTEGNIIPATRRSTVPGISPSLAWLYSQGQKVTDEGRENGIPVHQVPACSSCLGAHICLGPLGSAQQEASRRMMSETGQREAARNERQHLDIILDRPAIKVPTRKLQIGDRKSKDPL